MKVIVYTTGACPRCRIIKDLFDAAGIDYVERSLEDSSIMADLHMRDTPVMNAPSLEIAGMVFEYRGGDT